MSALMNKNDYQNDPLADGNPCNQISARCDLAGLIHVMTMMMMMMTMMIMLLLLL